MQNQGPDDQKNVLMAVVLSMLVVLGWTYFFAQPKMDKLQQDKALQEQKAASEKAGVPTATTGVAAPAPMPSAAATVAQPVASRDEALAKSARVEIATPSLKGSLSLKGALVDDVVLVNYHETVDPKSPNVVLFSPPEAPNAYYAKYGWLPIAQTELKLPDAETVWKQDNAGALTPANPVTLSWSNGQGLTFRRTFSVDDKYMLKIKDEVENTSAGDVTLRPFALLYRRGMPKTTGGVLHEGLIGVPGDAGLQEIAYQKSLEPSAAGHFADKTGGWLGITDVYWAAALVPDQSATYTATLEGHAASGAAKEFFTADYTGAPVTAAAGQRIASEGQLYAGAKKVDVVEGYESQLKIEKFNKLIDWGWFHFITRPLNHFLTWLYGIVGNFGIAILLVTVVVKALFYPLANKSYASMAKMKKLQPQMEALRDRFKDDKQRQQEELMKLYQKEKINPAAGCLPILLQIPVFFALYKVLYISIDMRHAPFFGWIKDLSAPDPTSIFNLFGLLPFAVPELLHVGAWPIIMGLTMWVQMQLNPPQPDPVQQQIFSWMPLMFTFLLAAFPAGLVIYWAWNNILSIAQQWHISSKNGAEIHLMDNLERTLGPIMRLFKRGETKG